MTWLEQAERIGFDLCRDAWWSGDRCTWTGDRAERQQGRWQLVHGNVDASLYEGTAGIALFLARLARHTGEALFRRTALGGARQAATSIEAGAREKREPGLYTGGTGVAMVALAVGETLGAEDLAARGLEIGRRLATAPDPGWPCDDLLAGRAGGLLAAATLARRSGDGAFADWAERLREELLSTAVPSGAGVSWREQERRGLAGISHGASGVALALAESEGTGGEWRASEIVIQALAYERSLFDAERRNWEDVRVLPGPPGPTIAGPRFMTTWCHGAPGIGLVRLRLLETGHGDAAASQDLEHALATTGDSLRDWPHGASPCLCHGAFGILELLLEAARERPELIRRATAVAEDLVDRHGSSGWPGGTRAGGISPGLMLGSAGVGYSFLRLHDRESVPSVLLPTNLVESREAVPA